VFAASAASCRDVAEGEPGQQAPRLDRRNPGRIDAVVGHQHALSPIGADQPQRERLDHPHHAMSAAGLLREALPLLRGEHAGRRHPDDGPRSPALGELERQPAAE